MLTISYNFSNFILTFSAGFIDFIVEPSFTVMGDMLDKILTPLRTPSQASVHDDPISEEVFDKEKPSTGGSRSSSARSNAPGINRTWSC